MSFRLVPKSVTLNDLERRNGRYFPLFQRIRAPSGRILRKRSRSLSHLLKSSCTMLYLCKGVLLIEIRCNEVTNFLIPSAGN